MLYFDKEGRERSSQQKEQSWGQGKAKAYVCEEQIARQPSKGKEDEAAEKVEASLEWVWLSVIGRFKEHRQICILNTFHSISS